MDISDITEIWFDGEFASELWIHFNINQDLKLHFEQELTPLIPIWPTSDGDIRTPFDDGKFAIDEPTIVGNLYDLYDLDNDLMDDITELVELAHEKIDVEKALLKWMLGTNDLTFHPLNLTTSYYNNLNLMLATDNKTGEAYFFFDDRSGELINYTGRYKSFENLALSEAYFDQVGDELEWHDFSIVSRFFNEIESKE